MVQDDAERGFSLSCLLSGCPLHGWGEWVPILCEVHSVEATKRQLRVPGDGVMRSLTVASGLQREDQKRAAGAEKNHGTQLIPESQPNMSV